jgi:RimJ/RimL family protein N-acetyltransferase
MKIALVKMPDKKPSRNPELQGLYTLYDKNREHLRYWHHNGLISINSAAEMRKKQADVTPYIIYCGNEIVGCLEIRGPELVSESYPEPEWSLSINAELSYWVDKDHARRGIAEAAIGAVEKKLFRINVDSIELTVENGNKASDTLAIKLGYSVVCSGSWVDFKNRWECWYTGYKKRRETWHE